MEGWVPFLIWGLVAIAAIIILRLLMTTIFSAIVLGLIYAAAALIAFGDYKVTDCKYDISYYDTIRSCILILSGLVWVVWSTYQVLRDNKQHRFCYVCRQKRDIVATVERDVHQYDDPDEESIASGPDGGEIIVRVEDTRL